MRVSVAITMTSLFGFGVRVLVCGGGIPLPSLAGAVVTVAPVAVATVRRSEDRVKVCQVLFFLFRSTREVGERREGGGKREGGRGRVCVCVGEGERGLCPNPGREPPQRKAPD